MNFTELKINSKILDGIKKAGYNEMTDIQAGIIPLALEKKDVIGQAPTGTGKTCAFVVPSLQELDSTSGDIQTLVMCPTRELALQITDEFKKIGQFMIGLKVLTIYGGQDIKKQLKGLKEHPQIIVGTPGRLLDHIERRSINLTKVRSIVLDEADEMLDMGFIRDINRILDKTNKTHQTLLLSATMEREILEISRKYQKDPSFFKATIADKDIPKIEQFYIKANERQKVAVIKRLIKDKNFYLVLIFTNTRHKAKWLVKQLRSNQISADALHSDLKQSARDRVMKSFREGKINVLVATDIAARGIDVKGIDTVINYDVPKNMEYYVHRIGRTARAQRTGSAYNLISNDLHGNLRMIERKIGDKLHEHIIEGLVIEPEAPHDFERRDFHDRGERRERHDRFERKPREPRQENVLDPNAPTTRFFVTVGFKDDITNESLKAYLVDQVGIPSTDIADVWARDAYSFIEVKTEHADKVKSIKQIKERKVDVAIANKRTKSSGDGDRRGGFGNHGGFHKKRFDNQRSFGDRGGFHKKRFSGYDDRPSFNTSSGPNMGDSPRFGERNEYSGSHGGFHKKRFGDSNNRGGFSKRRFGNRPDFKKRDNFDSHKPFNPDHKKD